jgi:hypothetical protein
MKERDLLEDLEVDGILTQKILSTRMRKHGEYLSALDLVKGQAFVKKIMNV